jgi:hypothetical protein
LMATAKRIGYKVGIGNAINNGLKSTPQRIAGTQPPGRPSAGGVVCPSTPEGRDHLLKIWRQTMQAFADIGGGIDYIWACAYDSGGCGCDKCKPWGSSAFLKISREVLAQEQRENPNCRLVLSTWMFDAAEWQGLAEAMAKDKSWVDWLMGGGTGSEWEGYPRYPLQHGIPGNLPLVNFPDISMWGMFPWGAYGANPQPARFQKLWREESRLLSGGLIYSEGIYEDINKAITGQLFWRKDRATDEIVREYIAFEYSPDVVEEVLAAIHILEGALSIPYNDPRRDRIDERVCQAYDLIQKADSKLSVQARHSWRWRVLYLRALIDCEIFRNKGKIEGAVLKRAFDELTEIYHAQNTDGVLQPLKLP